MQEIPFKEYLYQIWKRRNIVLVTIVSVLLLSILMTIRQQRIYRAMTVLEIGAETPDVALFQDVVNLSPYYAWWSAQKYYETQYQILQSRSMLSKVAQRALDHKIIEGVSVENLTSRLMGGLSVGTDEKSRLVKIYYNDPKPDIAQKLSILIAETYVDETLSQKLGGITRAVDWLNRRLKEIQEEKFVQEEKLQKQLEEYKMVPVKDREELIRANLVSLSDSLNRIRNQRIELEARYNKLQQLVKEKSRPEDLLGIVESDLIASLTSDLANLRSEQSKLSGRYMEKHPKMVRLNAQLEEVKTLIQEEVQNEVNRLKTKYLMAKAEESSVAKAFEEQKLESLRLDSLNRKVTDIQIVTQTNQELYEALQKKIKEADLSGLVRTNNVRIVDEAILPTSPISPNVKMNILLALVVGVLGGVGLALVLEYLDDTFKTHEDVERVLNLPTLGLIPKHINELKEGEDLDPVEFLPVKDPSSTIAEFYRTLRTNVFFLTNAKKMKKLLFVSTAPEEGKTATAINLAITMAQAGQKTVILDLDLRRPKLHKRLGVSNQQGLTHYLVGAATLESVIQKSEIENLDYITSGALPPNPAELLNSEELKAAFESLSKTYDRVIIDSSPIAPVTDAAILSQIVDGVILVIRAGKTHRKAVSFGKEQLEQVHANILGVVLNAIEIEKSNYEHYQYYKYGYYAYKDEPSKGKKEITDQESGESQPRIDA